MTKTKLKIEKASVTDVDGKLEQRKELAEKLEKKLVKFKDELESKSYLVEGKLKTAKKLKDYIDTEATWSFSESMGIIESSKQLQKAIEDLEKGRHNELMLSNLSLEAIFYFLSKKSGTGLNEAVDFFNHLVRPVSDALNRAKIDKDTRDQMERDLATVQNAIDMGAVSELEEQLLEEIKNEL